jgi:DNA-directed RNA polymerase subunit RPC12/RpoP
MSKVRCPECRSDGVCFCLIIGDERDFARFTFFGLCDHIKEETKDKELSCPYCGQAAEEHEETPMALQTSH